MPRVGIAIAALAVSSIVATWPALAHAEPSAAAPAYSYEIENAPPAGTVLVVWPRACSASGEPLGNVDLALNPDWASRMNDVDYEVLVKGKAYTLLEPCVKTSRLYLLPTDAFPIGSRLSTGDDVTIGQPEAGLAFAILPALDAIDRKQRIALFDHDARIRRTSFRFAATPAAPSVIAVHEVLSVTPTPTPTTFDVHQLRVIYTHEDGGSSSSASASASASASPSASSSASSSAPASAPAPAPAPDLGTRWVLLAALGGLLAGGLLAYSRKRRDAGK